MSHTPGPWEVIQDQYGVVEFIWGDTGCVCDLRSPQEIAEVFDGWMGPTKLEDARLIAAATELLEVCEALLAVIDTLTLELSESDWGKHKREAERKAKAALAKVRGKEGQGA